MTGTALTIGELAASAGVGVETVRYYERRGLLPEPPRSAAGYRRYSDVDRWRLQFIRRAKELGFSLGDVGVLLGAEADRSIADVRRTTHDRLIRLDAEISELVRRRDRLQALADVCAMGPDDACLALSPESQPRDPRHQPIGRS